MTEWWAEMACAGGIGLLLGRLWAGWAIWGYIQSKAPCSIGWRTAFFLRGKMYYVVTEREYVDRVMCAATPSKQKDAA